MLCKKNKKPINPVVVLIIGVVVLFIMLAGMGIFLTQGKGSFYENYRTYDAAYLPLIEPYKAVKIFGIIGNTNNKHEWGIDLIVPPDKKKLYYYLYIYDVTKIAVENKIIMAYSPDSISLSADDKHVGQKVLFWFVIVPDQNVETGFETEEEFLTYIHTLGIGSPLWVEPDVAYKQFLKTKCLDWTPNCK